MMSRPSFAAWSGMCASFLEIETVGLGPPAGLFRNQRPTVDENGLLARKLSVDSPIVGFVVRPSDQLPQTIAIDHKID